MTVLKAKIGLDSSAVRLAEVLGQRGDYRKRYCTDGGDCYENLPRRYRTPRV
jgi:hypothetical protein